MRLPGLKMARRGKPILSFLSWAWLGLGAAVIAIFGWLMLAPVPDQVPEGVILTLPAEVQRYAGPAPRRAPPVRDEVGALMAALDEETTPAEALPLKDDTAPSPEPMKTAAEIAAAEGPKAVVIRLPQSDSELATESAQGAGGLLMPDPALTASTPHGFRPAPDEQGRTPLAAYSRSEDDARDGPTLAIIVSGLGLDPVLTERAITRLPAEVGLSFAPYAKGLDQKMAHAMMEGHEVLIEIPMGQDGVPEEALGTAALGQNRPDGANRDRLDWVLSRSPAYPMATNYLGRTFSTDTTRLTPVLETLAGAGLGYIDDTGLAGDAAAATNLPYAQAAVVPGGTADLADRLDAAARRDGVTVVKVFVDAEGLDLMADWARQAPERGVVLTAPSRALEMP